MRVLRSTFVLAATLLGLVNGCDCDSELDRLRPTLVVNPEEAVLTGVPVAQDTPIAFQVPNLRSVNLNDVRAVLSEDSDPAFEMVVDVVERVLPGQTEELSITVRPLVVGTINATLIVDSDDPDARPNHVEVPITVTAINVGLPDIEVTPDAVEFATIGRSDVGRETVTIKNVGIRDLVLDSVVLSDDSDPAFGIALGGVVEGAVDAPVLGPQSSSDLVLSFRPQDTDRHSGTVVIKSNDPDEPEVRIAISAQAVECPIATAILLDDDQQIEPFDTVRIDGRDSTAVAAGTFIPPPPEGYQWTLLVRPIGSTAILASETNDRTELDVDLAGLYQVQLEVFAADTTRPDNAPIRSCAPAIVDIQVVPTDDLHIQLVWDSPDADLDLHVLQEDGSAFTHEGDVYFSNRRPVAPDDVGWSENGDENPRLDVDDDRGYGPENTNIKHPAPGSRWTVLVHYWNKQTSGDPQTNATVRLFVYGSQAIELNQLFSTDQQLWSAIEIEWSADPEQPPGLSQIGVVEPFIRPF
ncbi:MAG: choice-of-anchor D domain-containing protein [Deltaproteobacteria bacterium]|nr:choice-of-anchor D domain-containing protein [Deltaproteobacteria bacterium]